MGLKLKGTKERIFDEAIELMAKKGFEDVSMREIADEVGVQVSSIYNHFSSKEEILDTIYQYFGIHRLDSRNSADYIKAIIEGGTAREVIRILSDTAFESEKNIDKRMVLIPKIILMRVYKDVKASRFFLHDWYERDMEHFEKWIGYAVEIGRLGNDFEIEAFSMLFWKQLIAIKICAVADPNYEVKKLYEEEQFLDMFARLLPLKDLV